MADHSEQIQRIKDKLVRAKQTDHGLKVFGAERHKYVVHPPASEREVAAFENRCAVQLPACYRAFVTQIGNGGDSFANSAAGPYYGIYPLGENIDDLVYENAVLYLKNDCLIYPKITEEAWNSLKERIDGDEDLTDEEYDKELGRLFGGILPIGSQGCTYLHALILNGPHRGKVVNIDMDHYTPNFTFENHFLDWYERWLDEVISGELIKNKTGMFGFNKGGSDEELLNTYLTSNDPEERNDCLRGLLAKSTVSAETVNRVEELIQSGPGDKQVLVRLLCKSDYVKAKPYLLQLVETNLLVVFQSVYWYAKHKSSEWIPVIEENTHRITDAETFRFCTHLLKESGSDHRKLLIPFTKNDEEEIRVQAYYSLGQLKNRKDLVEVFISGLHDKSNDVVCTTLQALYDVKDERLLEHYRLIAEKFPEDQDNILTHLNHRLKEYGLTTRAFLNRTPGPKQGTNEPDPSPLPKKKWYEIWK